MAKVITRSEWTKIREERSVKQGRVAGVSIGKSLDAYHSAKNPKARIEMAKALLAAFSKYSSGLDMKNQQEQQLAREIGGIHIKAAKEAVEENEDRANKQVEENKQKLIKEAKAITVDKLLKNKEWMPLFTAFAKTEYVDESLEFIHAVDKKMKKQDLYAKYVSSDAPRQVNLPGELKNKFDEQAKANQFDKMDIKAARDEICDMLQRDVIPRFVKDKKFLDLLDKTAEEMDD